MFAISTIVHNGEGSIDLFNYITKGWIWNYTP
jgi:hypothetical protein